MTGSNNFCVMFRERGKAALETAAFDWSAPKAGELICQTLVSVVSTGSETGGYMDYLGISPFPYVSGYAAVLQVVEAGPESGYKPGDVVFAEYPHQLFSRIPAADVIPVPAGMKPEDAVLSRFPAITMTTMVETSIRPTEPVAVIGLGVVGLMCAQMLRHCGYTVYGVDPVEARRETAKDCGIDRLFASAADIPAESVGIVFECSGSDRATMSALPCIRKGGELSLVGVPWRKTDDTPVQELFRQVFYGYIHLRSGWEWSLPLKSGEFQPNSTSHNLATAMEWIRQGAISTDGIYALVSPKDCDALYQSMVQRRFEKTCAIYDWRPMAAELGIV